MVEVKDPLNRLAEGICLPDGVDDVTVGLPALGQPCCPVQRGVPGKPVPVRLGSPLTHQRTARLDEPPGSLPPLGEFGVKYTLQNGIQGEDRLRGTAPAA